MSPQYLVRYGISNILGLPSLLVTNLAISGNRLWNCKRVTELSSAWRKVLAARIVRIFYWLTWFSMTTVQSKRVSQDASTINFNCVHFYVQLASLTMYNITNGLPKWREFPGERYHQNAVTSASRLVPISMCVDALTGKIFDICLSNQYPALRSNRCRVLSSRPPRTFLFLIKRPMVGIEQRCQPKRSDMRRESERDWGICPLFPRSRYYIRASDSDDFENWILWFCGLRRIAITDQLKCDWFI